MQIKLCGLPLKLMTYDVKQDFKFPASVSFHRKLLNLRKCMNCVSVCLVAFLSQRKKITCDQSNVDVSLPKVSLNQCTVHCFACPVLENLNISFFQQFIFELLWVHHSYRAFLRLLSRNSNA